MNDRPRETQLRELLEALADRGPEAQIMQRLEALLEAHPDLQDLYLDHITLHAMLDREFGGEVPALPAPRREDGAEGAGFEAACATAVAQPVGGATARSFWLRHPWPVNLAAALVLVVSVFAVVFGVLRVLDPPQPVYVARLMMTGESVRWAGSGPQVGERLTAGSVRLQAGLARIDFEDGAEVTVEGPAEFDLLEASRGRLRRGKLTAHVPPYAVGFAVESPGAEVVDLGTEFGMTVSDAGDTEVHVFKGLVKLAAAPKDSERRAAALVMRLKQNEARRVERSTGRIRETAIEPKRFGKRLSLPGVMSMAGAIRPLHPPPPSVFPGDLESNRHILLFQERKPFALPANVTVQGAGPGRYTAFLTPQTYTLPAGTRVQVYMLHFDPVGNAHGERLGRKGTVEFERPILGVLVRHERLSATHRSLGAPGTRYAERAKTGLEGLDGTQDVWPDSIEISPDRRRLTFEGVVSTVQIDQVRVLVEAPE